MVLLVIDSYRKVTWCYAEKLLYLGV